MGSLFGSAGAIDAGQHALAGRNHAVGNGAGSILRRKLDHRSKAKRGVGARLFRDAVKHGRWTRTLLQLARAPRRRRRAAAHDAADGTATDGVAQDLPPRHVLADDALVVAVLKHLSDGFLRRLFAGRARHAAEEGLPWLPKRFQDAGLGDDLGSRVPGRIDESGGGRAAGVPALRELVAEDLRAHQGQARGGAAGRGARRHGASEVHEGVRHIVAEHHRAIVFDVRRVPTQCLFGLERHTPPLGSAGGIEALLRVGAAEDQFVGRSDGRAGLDEASDIVLRPLREGLEELGGDGAERIVVGSALSVFVSAGLHLVVVDGSAGINAQHRPELRDLLRDTLLTAQAPELPADCPVGLFLACLDVAPEGFASALPMPAPQTGNDVLASSGAGPRRARRVGHRVEHAARVRRRPAASLRLVNATGKVARRLPPRQGGAHHLFEDARRGDVIPHRPIHHVIGRVVGKLENGPVCELGLPSHRCGCPSRRSGSRPRRRRDGERASRQAPPRTSYIW